MPAYLVTLDQTKSGHTLVSGSNAMAVFAEDATQALEICAAKFAFEGAAWADDGTAVAIVQGADFDGWTFEVDILDGLGVGSDEPATVSVTGDATDNTIDEIGALLVIALNGIAGITGAAYNGTTNTLTIAAGTGVDDLGDQTVQVRITPPNGNSPIPSLVGTITHEGVATDDLSVILPLDAAVIPIVTAPLKQV